MLSTFLTSVNFGCPFLCDNNEPSTPFATPLLIIFDSIRTLCVVGGFGVLVFMPGAIAKVRTRGQWARFIALGLFALVLTNSNAHHFGDTPTIGTVLGFIGIGFSVYGIHRFGDETAETQVSTDDVPGSSRRTD